MKKKIKIPHIFVILVCIAILFAVLSWIIPAGAYDRVTDPNSGRTVIDPNSFHYLEKTPITFIQFISSYSAGFMNAASMIFMTLVVGGTFGIINELGIIPAALAAVLKKFHTRQELAVPFLILIFALFDSFMGAPELCMIFLPMILPLILSLGFDTMTAVAIVICGNCIGYSTGMGNPFTTIIGQKICQLPLYSGMWYRAICFVVFYIATTWYILRYAKKIRKNPELSATYEDDQLRRNAKTDVDKNARLSAKNKIACAFIVACFLFNIYGVIRLSWDIAEMTGLFLVMSVGAGVLSGHNLTETCKMFLNGAKDILQGALVMCFARTIAVIMTNSNNLDVFVRAISKLASAFPPTDRHCGSVPCRRAHQLPNQQRLRPDERHDADHVPARGYPACHEAGSGAGHAVRRRLVEHHVPDERVVYGNARRGQGQLDRLAEIPVPAPVHVDGTEPS